MQVNGYEIKPGADLRGAYLNGANLRGANLEGANLKYADLRGVDLEGANLYGAILDGANLKGADLRGAILWGANLRCADLEGADLYGANLNGADLRGADLRWAKLKGADLRGAYLEGAKIDLIPGHEELLKKVAEYALAEEDSLYMDKWHTCDTTHCIAGWATHLHPSGKELEGRHGSQVAGLFLLGAEAHSHFFDSNEDAKKYLKSVLG